MKAFIVLFFMFCIFSSYSRADVSLSAFIGTWELTTFKGSSFRHPEPYCAKKLEVDLDVSGMARGLHFTDIDGDWLAAGHYISNDIITKGNRTTDTLDESITFSEDTITVSSLLSRGMESYEEVKSFKISRNQMLISERIKGKMNLFSSKSDCTYKRL